MLARFRLQGVTPLASGNERMACRYRPALNHVTAEAQLAETGGQTGYPPEGGGTPGPGGQVVSECNGVRGQGGH